MLVTSSDGSKIYTDASGDPSKPSIVFIHGMGLSGDVFNEIFAKKDYTEDFYLVRYDQRGHGRSAKPDDADGYASSLYAADFKAVMDAWNLHRPVVVGWSIGGAVGADIAAYLPKDTIAGFIYLCGLPYIGVTDTSEVAKPLALTLQTNMNADLSTTADKADIEFIDVLFFDPEDVPWSVRTYWRGMLGMQLPSDRNFAFTRAQDPVRLFELGKDGLPVLVLGGEHDKLVDSEGAASILRPFFESLEIVMIGEGGSHAVFFDNMEETMIQVVKFRTNHK